MPSRPNNFLLTLLLMAAVLVSAPCSAQKAGDVKLRTVVIDAGHGGHDPGAVSKYSKLKEKEINLDLALRLGKKIQAAYPDVKVVYTRSTDVFKELSERGRIANDCRADLFISIHVNSAKSTSACGTETFVMGTDKSASNMEVCKRENSVILLEDDYSTTYQGFDPNNPESYIFFNLMQNAYFEQSIAMAALVQQNLMKGPVVKSRGIKQAPLMVLWKTTMPSVLVEVGFLSNAADRAVLNSESGRAETAGRIFDAFARFKKQYDAHVAIEVDESVFANDEPEDEEPADEDTDDETESPADTVAAAPAVIQPVEPARVAKEEQSGPRYAVQIFASSKKLAPGAADFKGLKCDCTFINGMYKYSVGNFSTKEAANKRLNELRKLFPGAFVVEKK